MGKSLVIKGADFGSVSVPIQVIKNGYIVVGIRGVLATLRSEQQNRSTLLLHAQTINNQLWNTDGDGFPMAADRADYALNPIPAGATKVKATCLGVKFSICVFRSDYVALFITPWSDSNGVLEINLSSYQNARYFSVNLQSTEKTLDDITLEFV